MKNKTFFLVISLILSNICIAQLIPKIHFSYDDAGNRVKREYMPPLVKKNDEQAAFALDTALNTSVAEKPQQDSTGFPIENTPTASPSINNDSQTAGLTSKVGGQSVSLYPNPTPGFLTIGLQGFTEIKTCRVEITDMSGREVYKGDIKQATWQIDLSTQPAGTYLINLWVNDKPGYYAVVKE